MIMRMADPFQTLLALQRSLDSARMSDWFGNATTSRGSYPPLNIFRQKDDYVVVAELPGVDKQSLEVEVHKNQLRIAGEKTVDYDEKLSVHRRERLEGRFDRTIRIPGEVDADKVKAEFQNGVLAVHLPRAESAKPRSVAVG